MTGILRSSKPPPSAWGQAGTFEMRDKGIKPVLMGWSLHPNSRILAEISEKDQSCP